MEEGLLATSQQGQNVDVSMCISIKPCLSQIPSANAGIDITTAGDTAVHGYR